MEEPAGDELLLRYRRRNEAKLKLLVAFVVIFFIIGTWILIGDEL